MSKKVPLTSEAYDIIKRMIIDLHFRPGEILMTQSLAEQLGISRTPVREALIKLLQEGLVVLTDSKKFQVAEVSITTINEIYDLRESLEILAIRKTMDKLSEFDIQYMQNNLKKLQEAYAMNEFDVFFDLDMRFHQFIIEKYNNSIVKIFMNQLMDRQQRIRYVTRFVENRLENTINEHQAIVNAFINKDLQAAEASVRYHIDQVRSGMVELINEKNIQYYMKLQLINNK